MRARWFVLSWLLMMAAPAPARAGQIHYVDRTLSQAYSTMWVQLLGLASTAHSIRVKVLRVFRAPARGRDEKLAYAEGTEATIALRPPYEWKDPRRSPIVERYWDPLASLPGVSSSLLLVETSPGVFEPTAYTPAKAAKLELFSQPAQLELAIEQATDKILVDNYRDRDLRALSLAALRARKLALVDILRQVEDRDAFFELMSSYHYNLEKERAPQNLSAIIRRAPDLSALQHLWFATWLNRNLGDPVYLPQRIEFFGALDAANQEHYEQLQALNLEVYQQLETIEDRALVERFARLFLRGLTQNPAYVGESLNGSILERLTKALPARAPALRKDFVAALVVASRQKKLEKDPAHLLMYFLISHLREAKDSAAIDEFARIDFKHPLFRKYFEYAVELIVDDESARHSRDRARVQKLVEAYPAAEFLRPMDRDKRARYDAFVGP